MPLRYLAVSFGNIHGTGKNHGMDQVSFRAKMDEKVPECATRPLDDDFREKYGEGLELGSGGTFCC